MCIGVTAGCMMLVIFPSVEGVKLVQFKWKLFPRTCS